MSDAREALFPAARRAIEKDIRFVQTSIDNAQKNILDRIETEKRAHSDVEFWKDELNKCVAKRQDLEAALERLDA